MDVCKDFDGKVVSLWRCVRGDKRVLDESFSMYLVFTEYLSPLTYDLDVLVFVQQQVLDL